jgi:hypothetical protein
MKIWEDEKSITYKIDCGCGSNEHIQTVDFELDVGFPGMLTICFYSVFLWKKDYSAKFFRRVWNKIKTICSIIFRDYVEIESSIILQEEEHIRAFMAALSEGLIKIEQKRKS